MSTPQPPAALALDQGIAAALSAAFVAAQQRPEFGFRLDLAGLPPVPAAFVRWLLLDGVPAGGGHVARAALWHATVADMLWLRGLHLCVTLAFAQSDFAGIDVTDATLPGLELIGGRLGVLRADRAHVEGSLLVRGRKPDHAYHHPLPDDTTATITLPGGALLCGATVHGNLDLRGAELGPLPQIGTERLALSADGLEVRGNALLCDRFAARGEVHLDGCVVGRDLDLSGAHLENPQGVSLSTVSAQVKGRLRLSRLEDGTPFRAQGVVVLSAARIENDLDASGAELTAAAFLDEEHWQPPEGGTPWQVLTALNANGCTIGGSLILAECKARGQVWVTRSHIGNDLDLSGSSLHFPGESALIADMVEVAGTTYIIDTRTNGLLKFLSARLEGGCACLRLKLSANEPWRDWKLQSFATEELSRNACGVYFAAAKVRTSLVWRDVAREPAPANAAPVAHAGDVKRCLWFAAQAGTADDLDDDLASWGCVDRINVIDFTYGRIENLGSGLKAAATALGRTYPDGAPDSTWRLDVLDREYASPGLPGQQAVLRFSPAPYLELARAYQRAGLLAAAREVLLKLERNRTRLSGLPMRLVLLRNVLDRTVRYGLEPLRLVPIVVVWLLASGVLFKWVHDLHRMRAVGTDHVRFNWAFYALDTLVPFVDFGQKKAFVIADLFSWGGGLLLLNALFGWLLIGILGGVVSGVVRSGKDAG